MWEPVRRSPHPSNSNPPRAPIQLQSALCRRLAAAGVYYTCADSTQSSGTDGGPTGVSVLVHFGSGSCDQTLR